MTILHRYLRLTVTAAALAACFSFASYAAESDDTAGPGIDLEEDASGQEETDSAEGRGELLGEFTTSGYCNCEKCSGGHSLTYSGTVPTPSHTISADLDRYPIGTKLWIDGTIYTVEDKGSSVKGNWIDIYYGSHEEALDHGLKTQEVYAVAES